MKKKILIGILVIIIAAQFIRPKKNNSGDKTYAIETKYTMPENVNSIMAVACNDCHTNNTRYPWYSNIVPVAWWLNDHVVEGKKHLNFDEFTNRPLAYQYHKLEETVEEIEEDKMPLKSYTKLGLHSDAKLSNEQKSVLIDWAKDQMAYLEQTYPKDSLVRKRR